jgi:S1-C subfamily serine protease
VVPQLIKSGHVTRPETGLVFDERLNRTITARMGVSGALILGVREGSPAAAAGLRPTQQSGGYIVPGDVIESVDGKAVQNVAEFNAMLERYKPGDKVTLRVFREGQHVEVPLALGWPGGEGK